MNSKKIKAIIPVAGPGTRLRPHTHTQPKPLIPVAGKPILAHIIETLLEAGIHDFVFVIGHLGEKIESFVRDRYDGLINAEFVVQSPRIGLGHAIQTAVPNFKDAEEALIVLGDTIFDLDLSAMLSNPYNVVAVREVEDPRMFGVAALDDDGFMVQAVEKPNIPKSNLALVGVYRIREIGALIHALNQLLSGPPSPTGEYHFTDALSRMAEGGVKITTQKVNAWFDCGRKESLLEANRILLQRRKDLTTEAGENCVVIPPVYISPGAKIKHSVIGPFVSVDENSEITHSIIRNSIVGSFSTLDRIILEDSVIGSDALLRGRSQSVNIGDNTEIDFNE